MSAPSTTLTTASLARASIPFREPEVEPELFDLPPLERELFDEPPLEREEDPDLPDAFLPPDAPVFELPLFDEALLPPALALLADEPPPPDDDLLLPPDELRPDDDLLVDDLPADDLLVDLPDDRDDEPPPADFEDEPAARVPPDPLDLVDALPPARDDPLFALDERDDVDPPFALDARDGVTPDFDDPLFELPLRVDDVDLPDVALPPREDPLFDEPDFDDAPDFELFVDDDFELDDLLPPLLPDDEVLVGIISSLSEIGIRNQFHATAKSTTQFVRCITFFGCQQKEFRTLRSRFEVCEARHARPAASRCGS